MRKIKITEKGRKKRDTPPSTKPFQFPLFSKLRGKRKSPLPGGGDVEGGGDRRFSPAGEDLDHPGRNFANSGGFLSATFNDYVPVRGRPIPRVIGDPVSVPVPPDSESESNDEEVSNYFRQRQSDSLATGFSATSAHSTRASAVSQRSPEIIPPQRWSRHSAVPQRALSEGFITNQPPSVALPKPSTTPPPLPYFHPPTKTESTSTPSSGLRGPSKPEDPSVLMSLSAKGQGSPAASGHSKSDYSVRPSVASISFDQEVMPQKPVREMTPQKPLTIHEPQAIQLRLPAPSSPIKTPPLHLGLKSHPELIPDKPSVTQIRRHYAGDDALQNALSATRLKLRAEHRAETKCEEECEDQEICDPMLAFISPIVRKSIRARYREMQPRYTDEPLFWVKPKCGEELFGPDGQPRPVWPPDSQPYPRSDFLLRNAVSVIREPKKVPVPKYLDSSTGKISNWSESGLARNYVYKPDFGKVPAYLASPRKPSGPINQAKLEAIMELRPF